MRPNELWTCQTTQAPRHKPVVVKVVVVRPVEEEEEGIGVASDIVKADVRIRTPQVM